MEVNRKYVITVLAFLVLAAAFGVFILESETLKRGESNFPMSASSINETGQDLQNIGISADSNLNFGEVPYKSSSTKYVNISSPRYARIELDASGNISDHVKHRDQVWMRGDKEISIKFNSSSPGNYTGSLRVKTVLAKNSMGERWLKFRKEFLS